MKEFDEDILYRLKDNLFEKFQPSKIFVKNAYNSTVVDDKDKEFVDLTSNLDNQPLGYSVDADLAKSSVLNSQLFVSNGEKVLTSLFAEYTGIKNAVYTNSVSSSYSNVEKVVTEYMQKSQKTLILRSCIEKNRNNYSFDSYNKEYFPLNNENVFKTIFSRKVGAVIIDLAQISDFVDFATNEFLLFAKDLCKNSSALLVLDASTIAPFRINNYLLNYNPEIKSDMVILPKGMANGFDFSGVLFDIENGNDSIHSSLSNAVCASVRSFLEVASENSYYEKISSNLNKFSEKLNILQKHRISVLDIVNTGFIYTLKLDVEAHDFAEFCFKNGVIMQQLDFNTVIMMPSYNITDDEIDKVIKTFNEALDKLANFDRIK